MTIPTVLKFTTLAILVQLSALAQTQLKPIPAEEVYKNIKFIPVEPGAKPLSYEELPEEYKGYFKAPMYPVRKELPKDWNIYRDDLKYTITFDGKAIKAADLDKYIPQTIHWKSHGFPINNEKKTRVAMYSEKGFYEEFPNGYPKVTGNIELKDYSTTVYAQPKFQGGIQGFNKYLATHLIIPDTDETKMKVLVQFYIETDGTIQEFKIMSPNTPEWMKPELERLFKNAAKWTFEPAYGVKKRTSQMIPIMLMGVE